MGWEGLELGEDGTWALGLDAEASRELPHLGCEFRPEFLQLASPLHTRTAWILGSSDLLRGGCCAAGMTQQKSPEPRSACSRKEREPHHTESPKASSPKRWLNEGKECRRLS